MKVYDIHAQPIGRPYTEQSLYRGLAAGIITQAVKDAEMYAKRTVIWKKRTTPESYFSYQLNKSRLLSIYRFFHEEHPAFEIVDINGGTAWQKLMEKKPQLKAVILAEFGTKYLK